jgi:DNA-binding transcriptional ArsR family regulator
MSQLASTVAVFRRWLHLPDPAALYAVLGAIAANRLPGDPVWLLLIGSPGSGKSELLQAATVLPDVHPTATLTEAALLSGTPKRERADGSSGGLLRMIGPFGILLAKDFGSVLSMQRDSRTAVLAALREVYDGEWTRHVGTDGGRTLHWAGRVGLIAGCTPTIDRHYSVMGAMGERFVLFRLPHVDAHEQAGRALEHAGAEQTMRAELGQAVATLFEHQSTERPERSEQDARRLVRLAALVVRCRSVVERDGYTREVELIPESEAPTRLVVVLDRLLGGLRTIGVEPDAAWRVVGTAALDSIPALRRAAMDGLLAAEGELKTAELAEAIGYPKMTTERALEDLVAHGVVTVNRHGQGRATTWQLAKWAAESYVAATSSEMSGGPTQTSSEKSGEAYIPLCTHTEDNSDEVGSATALQGSNGADRESFTAAVSAEPATGDDGAEPTSDDWDAWAELSANGGDGYAARYKADRVAGRWGR